MLSLPQDQRLFIELPMPSMGRYCQVTGIAHTEADANAYMAEHPGEGVIKVFPPYILIAKNTDLGIRLGV